VSCPVSSSIPAWRARTAPARELLGDAVVKEAVSRAQDPARCDPLAPSLPVEAARAELSLPDRSLVEALAAWRASDRADELIDASAGYLRPVTDSGNCGREGGPLDDAGHTLASVHELAAAGDTVSAAPTSQVGRTRLPAPVADAVRAVLAGLAEAPFRAPDAERLRQLGLDARAVAAAERAGLLRRLPGNVILAVDATDQAARILAYMPQPFTAAEARQALQTTQRVVIPLLEWLDRQGITR